MFTRWIVHRSGSRSLMLPHERHADQADQPDTAQHMPLVTPALDGPVVLETCLTSSTSRTAQNVSLPGLNPLVSLSVMIQSKPLLIQLLPAPAYLQCRQQPHADSIHHSIDSPLVERHLIRPVFRLLHSPLAGQVPQQPCSLQPLPWTLPLPLALLLHAAGQICLLRSP